MPKESETKKKLLVVTAVWGDWHISKYRDLNLPTLLAEGNFPALAEHWSTPGCAGTMAR
jgi:hypothetical protein